MVVSVASGMVIYTIWSSLHFIRSEVRVSVMKATGASRNIPAAWCESHLGFVHVPWESLPSVHKTQDPSQHCDM